MNLEAIALAALAIFLLISLLRLKRHNEALNEAVSSCPDCSGGTTVMPDPPNSQLQVRCGSVDCGRISSWAVRASALSVFGVVEFLLAFLAGYVGLASAEMLDGGPASRVLGSLLGFVAGGSLARCLVGLTVFGLLHARGSKLPPTWQEEIVAYLAPPPWRRSRTKDTVLVLLCCLGIAGGGGAEDGLRGCAAGPERRHPIEMDGPTRIASAEWIAACEALPETDPPGRGNPPGGSRYGRLARISHRASTSLSRRRVRAVRNAHDKRSLVVRNPG